MTENIKHMTPYEVGRIGKACGRKAEIMAVYEKALRVRYLEGTDCGKLNDLAFTPFEANIPKGYWHTN